MAAIKIERTLGPAKRAVYKGLLAFNKKAIADWKFKPLAVTVRQRGAIAGGLIGQIYFGWMFIVALWVTDELRGRGLGSKLMRAAEKEARKRGVRNVYLDSFSFQAPGFYRKLGYREFGRLNNFPAGHHRSFLTKAL